MPRTYQKPSFWETRKPRYLMKGAVQCGEPGYEESSKRLQLGAAFAGKPFNHSRHGKVCRV